jgi:hypothetical protein
MSQLDKLFRDRLEHYKKSPPPPAWNRINDGLQTDHSKSFWIKIAAGVIILLGASFLFWKANETTIVLAPITVSQEVPTVQENQLATVATPLIDEPALSPITSSDKRNSNQAGNRALVKPTIQSAGIPEVQPEEKLIAVTETPVEINSAPVSESMISNEAQPASTRSNKIIYSSNEVNMRFQKKDSTPTFTASVPPSPEKAESPIQKIKDIASGLKTEDASLSELREIKNEYLSFPLKTQAKDK